MKILFLTNLCDQIESGFHSIKALNKHLECSGMGLAYPLNLLLELSEYAMVDVYSPPTLTNVTTKGSFVGLTFVPHTYGVPKVTDAAELLKDTLYDVVISYAESMFSYTCNFHKIKPKKVMWFLSSPQQIRLPNYQQYFADSDVDLIINVVDFFSDEFRKLGQKTEWLPLSFDANRFRRMGNQKIVDVCLLGNLNPFVYPLRRQAVNYLSTQRYILSLKPKYGDEYVKAINDAKIFLTCSGIYRFPVMKYFEAMACGTLLMADDPLDAEKLGFKANENYVSLSNVFTPTVKNPSYPTDQSEWQFHGEALSRMLNHYLTCVGDREKCAQLGEQLVHERHTDRIRARELFRMLEKL